MFTLSKRLHGAVRGNRGRPCGASLAKDRRRCAGVTYLEAEEMRRQGRCGRPRSRARRGLEWDVLKVRPPPQRPPLANSSSPVSQRASSEARKTATAAISGGSAARPSGVFAMNPLTRSDPMESLVPSVAMNPGLTEFIRIPFGPSSFARTRVRESTAAWSRCTCRRWRS